MNRQGTRKRFCFELISVSAPRTSSFSRTNSCIRAVSSQIVVSTPCVLPSSMSTSPGARAGAERDGLQKQARSQILGGIFDNVFESRGQAVVQGGGGFQVCFFFQCRRRNVSQLFYVWCRLPQVLHKASTSNSRYRILRGPISRHRICFLERNLRVSPPQPLAAASCRTISVCQTSPERAHSESDNR